MDRASIVHNKLIHKLSKAELPDGAEPTDCLTSAEAISLFRSQCQSRALDLVSRKLQKAGQGFYTIGSSGHEGMAAVAQALQVSDMAFLHYRDAAFQLARAAKVPGQRSTWDMLMSFCCSRDDPISGGRHKVLGSLRLTIPPQTSTIASHLPKAMGAAYSVGRSRLWPSDNQTLSSDSIIMCSFGDASVNHSTAQGAFNTAGWSSIQSVPLPLLFVCEDNGIGISTKTPKGWVAQSMGNRAGIKYFFADGLDLYNTYEVAKRASDYVRKNRKPAFLHLRTVRLYGHAGADIATTYLPTSEVEADEANDPLLHSARLLSKAGALSLHKALELYQETCKRTERVANEAVKRPHITNVNELRSSLIPPHRSRALLSKPNAGQRQEVFANDWNSLSQPQVLSRLINWALRDLMLEYPDIVLMGEDIGRKGGVYGVTQKLLNGFGRHRVIDTLLDEQSILGLAIGMAHNGQLPIAEIQFLAYLHNAEDQLRGEAATLSFFSNGQYANPMVIRIAGLGYQKGFGGHFHNDNSLAVLRDIPGIVIACPSNGSDAVQMLRECVRLAYEEQRVVVFVEPIALYPMRDLFSQGDGLWMSQYPLPEKTISLGQIGCRGEGTDVAIVTYANGVYLSLQAQKELAERYQLDCRVIDIRWLSPLPESSLIEIVEGCSAILVVDECRRTGSQSEALVSLFALNCVVPIDRVTADDCFIATGPGYALPLPSRDTIVEAARAIYEAVK